MRCRAAHGPAASCAAAAAVCAALAGVPRTLAAQEDGSTRALSLSGALETAVGASEAVRIAEAEVARTTADIRRARSERLPQLNTSASYVRTLRTQFDALRSDDGDVPPPGCDGLVPNPSLPLDARVSILEQVVTCQQAGAGLGSTFRRLPFGRDNQWMVGLSVGQALFTGGRLSAGVRSAEAVRDAARVGVDTQKAQQTLVTAQTYYDALLANRLVEIVNATIEQTQQTLDQAIVAVRVGTRPEFDVLRARVAVESLRPALIQQQAARELAYVRLKQLVDLPLDVDVILTDRLDAMPDAATAPAEPEVVPSVEQRAPVIEARAIERALTERLAGTRAQRWPDVRFTGRFQQFAYPGTFVPALSDFVSDWTLGVGVQLPLFTGGRIAADIGAAAASLAQAKVRVAQARELTALDTRDAVLAAQTALATWLASAGTVEQAARAFQIAQVRFREGVSTQIELSDAQLQLQQARVSRAQAERDLRLARLRVALLPTLPLGVTVRPATPTTFSAPQTPVAPSGSTPPAIGPQQANVPGAAFGAGGQMTGLTGDTP